MLSPLKEHRLRNYLTVRELADKAGVSPDTVWRVENRDYKQLQLRTMKKLAAALGVHPSEIAEFAPKPVHENGG